MFIHAVVGVVPREEGGIAFFTFSKYVEHTLNLGVSKVKGWIDMTVKDMRRFEILNTPQTLFVTGIFTEQVPIAGTIVVYSLPL